MIPSQKPTLQKRFFTLLAVFMLAMMAACNPEEENPDYNEEYEEFYKAMKEWYYWTDSIPEINPSEYASLPDVLEAVRYEELDRWSFVTDWDEFWAYLNNSEFIGYGFGYRFDSEDKLRITYVFDTVEMYQQGVRRSWIIESINGTTITPGTNISQLLGSEQVGVTNSFVFRRPDGETVSLNFAKESVTMNTVLHREVIEVENLKIGYLVLQGFLGTTEAELEEAFAYFAQEGVNEMILDLRYNGGGLTSAAQYLSSLIAGPVLDGETFAKYSFNRFLAAEMDKVEPFLTVPNSLSVNRLAVIATGGSASASELVINALEPFMEVTIVGATTYGKPMGANVLRFNDVWAMVPISFKTKNAAEHGDYFDGLPVDLPANDDVTRMFGDPMEESLKTAIDFLLFGPVKANQVQPYNFNKAFNDHQQPDLMIDKINHQID